MNIVRLGRVPVEPQRQHFIDSERPGGVQAKSSLGDGGVMPFSAAHGDALRAVMFSGKKSQESTIPGAALQNQLIQTLQTTQDPDEKVIIADMLGASQIIRAIPILVDLLKKTQPIQVRSAAIRALGDIGNATHPDSYTRATLNQELMKVYEQAKANIKADVSGQKSAENLKSRFQLIEQRQDQIRELKEIAVAVGKLNVESGRTSLLQEYKNSLEASERNNHIFEQFRRAVQLAKEDFIRSLEQQFQKPIEEITGSLSPSDVRRLQSDIQVILPDGQKIGVRQAEDILRQIEAEQKFSSHLLLGLADGIAKQNDSQVNNILRLGLSSFLAPVKARSLQVLGRRNELNYISDIYPNLSNPQKGVRKAAFEALLHANDPTAKQTLMDYLNPQKFFKMLGESPSEETLRQFMGFLSHLAVNGDNYALPLIKVAANADFDLERRSIAMMVLQAMGERPFRKNITSQTFSQAAMLIKTMAVQPSGKTPEEQNAISLFATSLWVGLKDPEAVSAAIKCADDRFRGVSPKEQVELLGSVFSALQDDYDNARKDDPALDSSLMARRLLSLMKQGAKSPKLKASLEELEKTLKPGLLEKMALNSPEDVARTVGGDVQETRFVKAVRSQSDQLVPILLKMLSHEKSLPVRMVSARILGLLKATDTVPQLIEQTRDPLKGLMDWNKDTSFRGNPTYEGANIRLNNIIALGQIGDARALGVMLDAIDDPVLRRYLMKPIAQLAPAVNEEEDADKLAQVHEKLTGVISNPNTSRLQRSLRISGGDALFQFNGGVEALKTYLQQEQNPEFRRHVASVFLKNDYALDASHPDHSFVKPLLTPGLGVDKLHAKGITGKGVEIGIVDGGYIDQGNSEAFQDRIKLPARAGKPEHPHPTMVMTTAGGNGAIKGVAPDVIAYSEAWPDFESADPMSVYKKMIEGKIRGENNIRVINNSWGFRDNNIVIFKDVRKVLQEFKKVVNLAEKAGILMVFAAGNEGEETGIPGLGTLSLFGMDVDKLTAEDKKTLNYILDKVVLVGATNTFDSKDLKDHRIAEFSSLGDSLNRKLLPTVVAPGVDMSVYSYEDGKRTKELVNGTSFAAPYVSGLAALLWQKNPDLSPAQVRDILKATATPLAAVPDTYQGAGQVEPMSAVKMAHAKRTQSKKKPKPSADEPPATKPNNVVKLPTQPPATPPVNEEGPEAPPPNEEA